jgi:hypothetical protein
MGGDSMASDSLSLSRGITSVVESWAPTVQVDGRWQPGIGDPTFMGWVTVACYAAASGYALWAWRARRRDTLAATPDSDARRNHRNLSRLWLLCSALLAVLAINKQLDLQSWFTQVARDVAVRGGWYERRRRHQVAFVLLLLIGGAAGMLALTYLLRNVVRRALVVLVGIGMLLCFIVVRAASYHYVDRLLTYGPVRLNWVLEIGGIAVIAGGIAAAERHDRAVAVAGVPKTQQPQT